MKMWRVYQIFHNPQPNKRVYALNLSLHVRTIKILNIILSTQVNILTDWKLIIIVLVIVAVAILLLLVSEAIPFLRRTIVLVEDPEHGDGRNVRSHSYL